MTEAFDTIVGHRLRQRRSTLSVSQRQLGDQLHVSTQQIRKYETGQTPIVASRLQALSQALDVPVAYFFGVAEIAPPQDAEAIALRGRMQSADCTALNKAFQKIEDRKLRRKIVGFVEGLADHCET